MGFHCGFTVKVPNSSGQKFPWQVRLVTLQIPTKNIGKNPHVPMVSVCDATKRHEVNSHPQPMLGLTQG